jgi:hypothetical protein
VNVFEKCGVDKTFPEIHKCPVFFNNETTQNGEGDKVPSIGTKFGNLLVLPEPQGHRRNSLRKK